MDRQIPQSQGTSGHVRTIFSTGLTGFDQVIQGVMPGDNIVLRVDSVDDYAPFVHPFCVEANRAGRELIYFRFADHEQLMPPGARAATYVMHPEQGFETFLIEIHRVIEKFGYGACYVFDCLSELAVDWYSDRMLGNFFMLTCPYLYDFETATYFGLLRNTHTQVATNAIHNTAQVVVDIYNNKGKLYIHPLKVWKRHTPTMYTLHSWDADAFNPVTHSSVISEILSHVPQRWLDSTLDRPDLWTRTFTHARELVEEGRQRGQRTSEGEEILKRLLRMVVSRDRRFLQLAEKFLDIPTLLDVGRRMIGTGLIGGKSAGMVLARAILKKCDGRWDDLLEAHDSFYIGSDVFYTYLVTNGCWHVCRKQRDPASALDSADEARQRLLSGSFPDDIKEQFTAMLDYFGQSPIIVRSSSLLEDAYGNAFSGKYESVFCANQGTPQERLETLMDAVRTVYASTTNKNALLYRIRRGLFDRDEQMALLVQRVSGGNYASLYYPQIAGVGFSFNPYVWSGDIDPNQGMLRLVFGLGTRAVERSDDDYTRIVALNAPNKRPEATFDEVKKYSQRKVDVLDLDKNMLRSVYFDNVVNEAQPAMLDLFATRDEVRGERQHAAGRKFSWVLTFEDLFSATSFVKDMRTMLRCLHDAYENPVDIEFTANFLDHHSYKINLVQCRPFQAKGDVRRIEPEPDGVPVESVFLRTRGPIIGPSIAADVNRLVFVDPRTYSRLSVNERYGIARLIGRVTHAESPGDDTRIMLVGPGRWGTTTPSLGVPVSFGEINTVSIVCEVALMHEGLVPDVSLGTHFFNDLVEMEMLYCAVFPERDGNVFNEALLLGERNALPDLVPEAASWANVVHVIESPAGAPGAVRLNMNAVTQKGVCYKAEHAVAEVARQDTREDRET
jgi:pyruvate,water dikinase